MPFYLIERNFAEQLEVRPEGADTIIEVGNEMIPSGATRPINKKRFAE